MEQYWTEAQAEIEKLKVEKIRAYDNGVEDGRKHNTNNEPVAYGKYLEKHDYWVTASGIIPNPKEGYVPLYTHPAKTLTDEEIEKLWFENVNPSFTLIQIKDFARAILRKAQEK
jgi:hypothetical protein